MTLFFLVPKVSCNATTCSGQGICTDDGICLCDNGFYTDNCSSKFLDLHYSINIFVLETQPILYMGYASVLIHFMEIVA